MKESIFVYKRETSSKNQYLQAYFFEDGSYGFISESTSECHGYIYSQLVNKGGVVKEYFDDSFENWKTFLKERGTTPIFSKMLLNSTDSKSEASIQCSYDTFYQALSIKENAITPKSELYYNRLKKITSSLKTGDSHMIKMAKAFFSLETKLKELNDNQKNIDMLRIKDEVSRDKVMSTKEII